MKKQSLADRALARAPKATPAQLKYLDSLFLDCGFSERSKRNVYLTTECDRPIKYPEELTKVEATRIISELVELRDKNKPKSSEDDMDEEDMENWDPRGYDEY
jgi:enolase